MSLSSVDGSSFSAWFLFVQEYTDQSDLILVQLFCDVWLIPKFTDIYFKIILRKQTFLVNLLLPTLTATIVFKAANIVDCTW